MSYLPHYPDSSGTEPEPRTMVFLGRDGKPIGTLHLEKPIRFEGDAEESARIFFDSVIKFMEEKG